MNHVHVRIGNDIYISATFIRAKNSFCPCFVIIYNIESHRLAMGAESRNITSAAEDFVESGACIGAAFAFASCATLISGGNIVRHS